jgi:hypothetical protein
MRAWTLILGLPLFACGGGDANIGANDSGNPQEDGSNGGADTGQPDGSMPSDSGPQDDSGDPNGNDSGTQKDGGTALDSGTCVPKVFTFGCLNQQCQLGEGQYCANIQQGGCTVIPPACKCDYTCKCLLANVSKGVCGGMIVPKCNIGGSGQLNLTCN